MRQKLCRRLEELEKFSKAAAATRRLENNSGYEQAFASICEAAQAWHAKPENQKWLAEQPPDYRRTQMKNLRQELLEMAGSAAFGVAT